MIAIPAGPTPVHGGQLREISARFGIEAGQLLDLSANINPGGLPPSALAAIQRALADPKTLVEYPDLELAEVKLAVANCFAVQPANISVANGFVPLLDAALRSFKIERCMLPIPCFSEYRAALENVNATVMPFQLSTDSNFRYDPAVLLKECLDCECDAVLLANPQNPSGVLCAAEQIKQLVEAAARHHIAVLLDEAFIDYCPNDSLVQVAVKHERVIVFRSVTKFYATPGLRIAFAVGNPSVTEAATHFLPPWPVTSFASDAVCAMLLDHDYAENSRYVNERQRSWVSNELARLKVRVYASQANFLLLQFSENVDAGWVWERMIVDQHIVLRSCTNFEGLAAGHLRVAVRSKHDNERFIRGLEQVLSNLQD